MGKLISVSLWAEDSTQYSPSVPAAFNEDWIKYARPATLAQKQSYPTASTQINTQILANYPNNNTGDNHVFLILEGLPTLISGSN